MISLFGSTYKTQLLSLFLNNPHFPFTTTQLINAVPTNIDCINNYLSYLEKMKIIKSINSTYILNPTSSIVIDINSLQIHLDLEESDLAYVELLKVLRDYKIKGLVVCESPNLEGDALLLQTTYNSLPNDG